MYFSEMKKFILIIALFSLSLFAFPETWAERKLTDGGYARVAYMSSDGALHVSIQTEVNTEYILDITVTCTHKWKTEGATNSDGTFTPGKWNEELYVVCNKIFNKIPVNKQITLTEGVNNPPKNTRYDIYTNYNVILNNIQASSEKYRLVFYAWGVGTIVDDHESHTGHAFVYIPEIGHTGFGHYEGGSLLGAEGAIFDHSDFLKLATDSCVFYISKAQLVSVKNKYRELENNVPKYRVGDYDCVSFVMDIADAAGIHYGNRSFWRMPTGFITELKKRNP